MISVFQRKGVGVALTALALAASVAPAFAQTAPVPNKGDTSWMLISSALVLMMSIPGLALFYGGLVRSKNMLSVLTQVFAIVCITMLIWVTYGYSLAFTNGGGLNDFVGGFSKAFLAGVDANSVALTSDDCTNTRTNAETFNSIWVTDVDGSARAFLLQIS
jgi:hypothetical protein